MPSKKICFDCSRSRAREIYKAKPNQLSINRYKSYKTNDLKKNDITTLNRHEAFKIMSEPCYWCGDVEKIR